MTKDQFKKQWHNFRCFIRHNYDWDWKGSEIFIKIYRSREYTPNVIARVEVQQKIRALRNSQHVEWLFNRPTLYYRTDTEALNDLFNIHQGLVMTSKDIENVKHTIEPLKVP